MRFSIRDLLLVTVIMALAVVWWVDRTGLKARLEKLEQQAGSIAPPVIQHIDEVQILDSFRPLPNSSAPAPNPPKP